MMNFGSEHITLELLPPITIVLFMEWLYINLDKLLKIEDMEDNQLKERV